MRTSANVGQTDRRARPASIARPAPVARPESGPAAAGPAGAHAFGRIAVHADAVRGGDGTRRDGGQAGRGGWAAGLQGRLSRAFQISLDDVPLAADPGLARHGAAAAADGVGIRVAPRWLQPESRSGQHLIAHEVAHLVQQTNGTPAGAAAERDADAAADRFVAGQMPSLAPAGGLRPAPAPPRFKSAVEAAKEAIRAAADGLGTDEEAINNAIAGLTPDQREELAADADIMALLREELSGTELAFVMALLEKRRVGDMNAAELAAISANPTAHRLGTVAGAKARETMLQHQASVAATGTGTIHGNKCTTPAPAGATSADCTTYVLDVLKSAFAAKGESATWTAVMAEANRTSGGKLKGTELLVALQAKAGWEGVFWAPDPRNPEDASSEHPVAYRKATKDQTYYGVKVDASKSVIDYRRTAPTPDPGQPAQPRPAPNMVGIERLRRLDFGVLAARGGRHMALIVNGSVYEIHWDRPATDPTAIEATPLESFAWQSGVIVAPKGDLARAWRTP